MGFGTATFYFLIESIYKVETDGPYENKIAYLYDLRGGANGEKHFDFNAEDMLDCAQGAMDDDSVVCVGIAESEELFTGTLTSVDQEAVLISVLDQYGRCDGKAVIQRKDIDYIELDSLDCQAHFLLKMRN